MGTYMCLDKPCMGTLLFTCMLVGAWRCPTLHGHRALHVLVGRSMEVPHPAWAQGSSRACWQEHGGALPHMGTGLFTCMLSGIMEVPRLAWAHGSSRACWQKQGGALPRLGTQFFTCLLAGSMEVPEVVHAHPSIFLPTATICEDQWCLFCCLLGLLSAWCHCIKRGSQWLLSW